MSKKYEFDKVYAVDTNVILHDAESVNKLLDNGNNLVVIPETVIEELDKFKVGYDEINFQAREFSRFISKFKVIETFSDIGVLLNTDSFYIFLARKQENELTTNDDIIINTVNKLRLNDKFNNIFKYKTFKLLSNDILFRVKALTKSLVVEEYSDNLKNKILDNFGLDVYIDNLMINKQIIHKKQMEEIINQEIPEHISYLKITDKTNNLFVYVNNFIGCYEKIDLKSNFYIFNIKAKNLEQRILWNLLLNTNIDINVIHGIAGTGKTLSALLCALKLVELKKYDKITYIRKTVISGDKLDEIGFLPGDTMSKIMGYLYPIRDNIEMLIRSKNKKKKKWTQEELEKAIEDFENNYNINYEYLGHLRGRNLSGVVLIDECQNFSVKDLITILSRITENTKVIIMGSLKQIDNPYLNKYNNALTFMMNHCGTSSPIKICGITLHSVHRGKITEWIEDVTKK